MTESKLGLVGDEAEGHNWPKHNSAEVNSYPAAGLPGHDLVSLLPALQPQRMLVEKKQLITCTCMQIFLRDEQRVVSTYNLLSMCVVVLCAHTQKHTHTQRCSGVAETLPTIRVGQVHLKSSR